MLNEQRLLKIKSSHLIHPTPICVLGAFRVLACEQAPEEREKENPANEVRPADLFALRILQFRARFFFRPRRDPFRRLFVYEQTWFADCSILHLLTKMQQIHHLNVPKFAISQPEAASAAMISRDIKLLK